MSTVSFQVSVPDVIRVRVGLDGVPVAIVDDHYVGPLIVEYLRFASELRTAKGATKTARALLGSTDSICAADVRRACGATIGGATATLNQMARRGELVRVARGRFALPKKGGG